MRRPLLSWLTAAGITASVFVGAVLVDGCGSVPCSDTDTCPGTDDGAPQDQSVDSVALPEGATEAGDAADAGEAAARDGGDSSADAADARETDGDATVAEGGGGPDGEAGADSPADVTNDANLDGGGDAPDGDGCVSHPEDCTNGIDDDCNGLIDCADPACKPGFECVPDFQLLSGWTAPTALYDDTVPGGPAPTAPGCVSPYKNTLMSGHDAPTVVAQTCSGCACGPVVDAGCSAPTIGTSISGCGPDGAAPPPSYTGQVANTSCTSIETAQGGINSAKFTDPGTVSGGACVGSPIMNVPPWNPNDSSGWAGTGLACSPDTSRSSYFSGANGGCPAQQACIPKPPSTLPNRVCLLSFGHIANCPSNYGDLHRYYDGGTDNRGCSNNCTCGAPTGLACTPTATLYSGSGCSSGAVPLGTSNCANLSNFNAPVTAKVTFGMTAGSCASGGSTSPTGAALPTGETTVCCTGIIDAGN